MKKIVYFSFLLYSLTSCQPSNNSISNKETNLSEEFVKGELIVMFKSENSYQAAINNLVNDNDVQLIKMLMVTPPDAIIGHFRVPKEKEREMIAIFETYPEIKSAELNLLGSFNDIPANEPSENETNNFIKGKVESIENGKDGYTAKIKTMEGKFYFATISIPNLGRENAHQYRSLNIGETVEIKGEIWEMNNEQHITVREIKK